MKSFTDYKSVALAANETKILNLTGVLFLCVSATGNFNVSLNDSPFSPLSSGLGIRLADGEFIRIALQDTSGQPNTVQFFTGTDEVIVNRVVVTNATFNVNQQNAPTFGTGNSAAPVSLAAAAVVAFAGTSGSDVRKQFIVTNHNLPPLSPDSTAPDLLYVLDSADQLICPVYPQRTVTFESGGQLKVKNPMGVAVFYSVGQIWYDL